jgi:hypothetical protein
MSDAGVSAQVIAHFFLPTPSFFTLFGADVYTGAA